MQIPKSVREAYFMLEEVKREQNVLKTREEGLTRYLSDALKDGPVDGIMMKEFTRSSRSWVKVVEAVKKELPENARVLIERYRDEYTKESKQVRFSEVPKE